LLFFHVFINIGMSIGVAPVSGLSLPLVSYGGSFIVITMAALGLMQSIRLHGWNYDA
jgi:rod shape determining protein RodA